MPEQPSPSLTARLARLLGMASEYEDAWHQTRQVPLESQEAVLHAMGHHDMAAALRELEKHPWNRLIEPVFVISEDEQPASLPLHFPLTEQETKKIYILFTITRESGETRSKRMEHIIPAAERDIDGTRYVRVDVPTETILETGYHTMDVRVVTPGNELSGTARLIVAPARCHLPPRKTWGITLSLYSLRSEDDWGIGDLGCLKRFMAFAQDELQAGFVGISPLHATANKGIHGISPYYPISRLYHNLIYIDMPSVLQASQQGRTFLELQATKDEISRLRSAEFVDYEGVAALKSRGLRVAWEAFREQHADAGTPLAGEFEAYITEQGRHLELFSTFMALGDRLGYDSRHDEWTTYQDPDSDTVITFAREHANDIRFHQFVQWTFDRQLAEVADISSRMSVGLYCDLAVGSAPAGSDAWGNPGVFIPGIHVGAPPDAFNASGQNWGFPPLSPQQLRETAFDTFIQTIRHNVRHAGALRIDHALGLFRMFWIPKHLSAPEGTYIRYPYEDLLKIVALESMRQRAVIIAEDLGTVGDEVREALHGHGMLSYRLLYFERDRHNRRYYPPDRYPSLALAAATTHDLPTLKGFWDMHDIDIRAALGLFSTEQEEGDARESRASTLKGIEDVLRSAAPEDGLSTDEERLKTVYRFLASTPSLLVSLSLDDALGLLDQQNLPGVVEGHPNWRRRYPLSVEDMCNHRLLLELAGIFRKSGRANGQP